MNLRNTYILFAAVVVVLVVFLVVLTYGPRAEDDYLLAEWRGRAKGDELAEIKKSIDRLEIERLSPSSDVLLFERTPQGWRLVKPYPARVDSAELDRLVGNLFEARIDRRSVAPTLQQAGLDPPSAAVTLFRGEQSLRIMFGQMSLASGGRVYAARGDRPKRVLILPRESIRPMLQAQVDNAGSVGESLRTLTDFRATSLLADGSLVPWDTVQKITLAEAGREIVLQKAADNTWSFLKPDHLGPADMEGDPASPATQTIAGVKPLLTRLSGLRLPAREDIIEGAENLGPYGLEPGKESLRIELGRTDGSAETLLVGKTTEDMSKVYVTLAGERLVVKLDAKAFEPIRAVIQNPKAMRDRTLTHLLPFNFDAIDIQLPGEAKPIELRRLGTPPRWYIFEGGDAFETASEAAVNALLDALTAKRNIRDFPDSAAGDKAFGLDTPAAVVRLWSGGIAPTEGKSDQKAENATAIKRPTLKGDPTLQLAFGKKDKDIVFVRRTSGVLSILVALPETLLPIVTRPLTDYLDTTLPSFESNQVTRLTFNRGETKYEIEKPNLDPAASGWSLKQPPEIAGRTADTGRIDQIVNALKTLSASKVIAKEATDAELARFGLQPALTEASVSLKDAPEPRLYRFGKETDDKQSVYARIGKSARVYLVPKSSLDPLVTGELIDPTIWRLEAEKVRGIKITGWRSLTGGMPLVLDLQRKSATEWAVKDQPDYVVDAAKAEAFAGSLYLLRTDRFVKNQGGPLPEHKLGDSDDTLRIEITVEGEKEPFLLTLGAETNQNKTDYYFATSNRTSGAVFLVFRDRFAELRKAGRGYFQKK
jgi:hypothetical protein